jgi:hypothetical protein
MPYRYSVETCSKVVAARKRGLSWAAIVREVRTLKDVKAARTIWKMYEQTNELTDRPVSGRPVVLSPAAKKRIDSALAADPWVTPAELVRDLHLEVSERTVRRYRNENYCPVKGVGRPVLSAANQILRRKWAEKHVHEDHDDWVFTDEKSFFLYKVQRQAWVKRGAKLPFRTQPAHAPRVQVLGGISRKGRTKLVIFKGWLNGAKHRENLDAIMPSTRQLYPDGFRYLQDNDPSHTDKRSLRHLESMVSKVQRMPAQSPDFNVIEHVWAELDRRVAARAPQTVADLERIVKDEWSRLTVDDCNRYIDGLGATLQAVIAAGGRHVTPQDRRRYVA